MMSQQNRQQPLNGNKVLVVDNGGQWTFLEERMLRELGAKVSVVGNSTVSGLEKFDAVVLSGGSPRIDVDELGEVPSVVDACVEARKPLLGICVGHQYLALHFGGEAGPAEIPEFGGVEIEVLDAGGIFRGIPTEFRVWESHNDEVKDPGDLLVTARSDTCQVQAIRHPKLPIFGVQFHPEVHEGEFGADLFCNFLTTQRGL